MVVDCCSITRDSDFTILGEPRRDPEHLVTSGAFTGQIQGQQTHLPPHLSHNLRLKTESLTGLEILVAWLAELGVERGGGGRKVRESDS